MGATESVSERVYPQEIEQLIVTPSPSDQYDLVNPLWEALSAADRAIVMSVARQVVGTVVVATPSDAADESEESDSDSAKEEEEAHGGAGSGAGAGGGADSGAGRRKRRRRPPAREGRAAKRHSADRIDMFAGFMRSVLLRLLRRFPNVQVPGPFTAETFVRARANYPLFPHLQQVVCISGITVLVAAGVGGHDAANFLTLAHMSGGTAERIAIQTGSVDRLATLNDMGLHMGRRLRHWHKAHEMGTMRVCAPLFELPTEGTHALNWLTVMTDVDTPRAVVGAVADICDAMPSGEKKADLQRTVVSGAAFTHQAELFSRYSGTATAYGSVELSRIAGAKNNQQVLTYLFDHDLLDRAEAMETTCTHDSTDVFSEMMRLAPGYFAQPVRERCARVCARHGSTGVLDLLYADRVPSPEETDRLLAHACATGSTSVMDWLTTQNVVGDGVITDRHTFIASSCAQPDAIKWIAERTGQDLDYAGVAAVDGGRGASIERFAARGYREALWATSIDTNLRGIPRRRQTVEMALDPPFMDDWDDDGVWEVNVTAGVEVYGYDTSAGAPLIAEQPSGTHTDYVARSIAIVAPNVGAFTTSAAWEADIVAEAREMAYMFGDQHHRDDTVRQTHAWQTNNAPLPAPAGDVPMDDGDLLALDETL